MNWIPDYYFQRLADIPPDFFCSRGIRAAVLDIDNTLAPDQAPDAADGAAAWLAAAAERGTALIVLSNNRRARVEPFCEKLDLPFVCRAGKPSLRSLPDIRARCGVPPREIAVVGDQVFTDVLFAKRAGMRSVLLAPLGTDRLLFVKVKRMLERPLVARWKKRGLLTEG